MKWKKTLSVAVLVSLLVACRHVAPVNPDQPKPAIVQETADGIRLPINDGWLSLQPCAPNIIRVSYTKHSANITRKSLDVVPQQPARFTWAYSRPNQVTLKTSELAAQVDLTTGAVTFLDSTGQVLQAEQTRKLQPANVQGEQTWHVRQDWKFNADESLYGLGQNQLGLTDIKGYDLDLWQHNGTIVIPFLVSSRGYGILWDNPSFSRFGDLRPFTPIPPENLRDTAGQPGGLTASYFAGSNFDRLISTRTETTINIERPPSRATTRPINRETSIRWEGQIFPTTAGDYQFQTMSNGDIKVWIDGKLVINHWRQGWLPWLDVAKIRLEANRPYPLKVEWSRQGGNTVQLLWKTPALSPKPPTSLWSEVAEGIDYYFVYGPKPDRVISGYRQLTGRAPLMPIWALGLWQSRQRYETAQQSLDVIAGYRSRHIPFDNIVQDWQYWPVAAWGSHEFDPKRFPDPTGWIKAIHDAHAHLMISVWGKFYTGTKNFDAMQAGGFLYQPNLQEHLVDWLGHPYTFFDAFNAAARALFWSQIKSALFDKGVDAWWMDATEPDLSPDPSLQGQKSRMTPTALGPGTQVLNAYSIMIGQAIFNGQQSAAPDQRVFILTRSGFAGQQRYAEASWSGDISSTWTAMRKQIPAGLGFCISGVPYWTMDIGGFSVPPRFSAKNPKPEDVDEWRELFTRWFEFGTFCPLLRVHGEAPFREMWEFGGDRSPAYFAQIKFDRLRYSLLPYLYSLVGNVTLHDGTIMRNLVMDFTSDAIAREISDQYMFGPAFLVSPVTNYKARTRPVYLPAGTGWYDFWTGAWFDGGQTIEAPAPFDSIPLHIRAGSIIPLGPVIEYTTQPTPGFMTLYVYEGANGYFTLYQDDGLTRAAERGQCSQIPIHWDDSHKILTIGNRQGAFPTMPAEMEFNIIFVSRKNPVGVSLVFKPSKGTIYDGKEIQVQE